MIIYKITNKINGKVYIGQTVRPLNVRIKQHLVRGESLVSKAIKKYGIDKFIIEQIDRAKSKPELDRKERYWIGVYDCVAPNGYNLTSGGEGGDTMSNNPRLDEIKIKIGRRSKSRFDNPAEKEKYSKMFSGANNPMFGRKRPDLVERNKRKQFNYLRGEKHKLYGKNGALAPRSKKVICVETNIVYVSARDAHKHIGGSDSGMSMAIKFGRSYKGYHWRFVDE